MLVGRVKSYSPQHGGRTTNGIFIHKSGMGVYERGAFRRYRPDELKQSPTPGQEIRYVLDKKSKKLRAYWWGLVDIPVPKLVEIRPNTIETAKVVTFHQDRRFGFVESPVGGEDLFIHLNECYEYRNGEFRGLTTEIRGPSGGSFVALVRNGRGRVEKWGIINAS